MQKRGRYFWCIAVSLGSIFFFWPGSGWAQETEVIPVEINGDTVEYSMAENKVVAQGKVSAVRNDVTLLCDKLEFFRATSTARAEGNVVLIRKEGRLTGERMTFNFETMKGEFEDTKFYAKPFFGAGEKMEKIGKDHLRLTRAYLTTCDLDKPHFRFAGRKVDVYPGDKAVARNVRMIVGRLPIIYIPRFTQDLRGKKPVVTYTPGYDKDWGAFLLTQWRHPINDNLQMTVHLDYRTRKDLAWGIDSNYKTSRFGEGAIRTYYMNERDTGKKHNFWEERLIPTTERERFKGEWRHKWDIDGRTSAIWQYFKVSDRAFLKDYFERDAERDINPPTYALITRRLPLGVLSFRADARVNRFVDAVERLPEVSYNLANKKIGGTGLYFKTTSTYSDLVSKLASPSEYKLKTHRMDVDNELSRPLKLSIFEIKPFVGERATYYSRSTDTGMDDLVRGIFRTGADISTKFFRIFDVSTDTLGLNVNRLRHVITPSAAYEYQHDPSIAIGKIPQFDEIDAESRSHLIKFSLENKLQTKRDLKSVDLARLVLGSDFNLKENPGKGGFQNITSDLEIKPYTWLAFYFDSYYNTISERLASANFDLYVNNGDKWSVGIGKRYSAEVDDQLTTEFNYKINQKWALRVYERFDLGSGTLKEQEYKVSRDLHCWTLDLNYNQTRGEGNEIMLVFTLKAFPELALDAGQGFNKRKAGTQVTTIP